jgi:hypothetical protein
VCIFLKKVEPHVYFLWFGADPQKQYADAVIEVLPTQLIPGDNEGKVLRVRLIMKEGVELFSPVYLFDEGSSISWIPCGRKLTCSYPGIKFFYGPDAYFGHEVPHKHSVNILCFLCFFLCFQDLSQFLCLIVLGVCAGNGWPI